MKICVDPGHGYLLGLRPTGARANALIEDDVVYGVKTVNGTGCADGLSNRLAWTLRGHKHQVVMTRDKSLVSIGARAKLAVREGCDLFVSLHCNAGAPLAQGFEIYVAEGDVRSRALANKVLQALKVDCPEFLIRGVRWDNESQHPRLGVLRGTYKHMPAMLIEAGFLTSPHDSLYLCDPKFRQAFANAVARAITR